MLILYDINHNKLQGLTSYKDLKVDKEINVEDTLSFLFPVSDPKHSLLQEECYIRTKENEYVIKEVNYSDDDWTEYVCKLNVEELKGTAVSSFETVEQTCTVATNAALAGTGWTIGTIDVTKVRTVRKNKCSVFDVLKEIQSVYICEMSFDSILKKVYIYQSMGSDRGSYFAEQLNLKSLSVQRNSYDFITRLIPLAQDGLGIEAVNGGVSYVENYQYSNKIITAYWEDNRYSVLDDLKEDAIVRLARLSVPYKSYSAEILDLAGVNPEYSILDYDLGDTITLLSKSKLTKEKQRIIKLTHYPDEPERNTCEIANKLVMLDDLQVRLVRSAEVVDTITTSDGMINGSKLLNESIENAKLGQTIIVGGYILTSLLNVSDIIATGSIIVVGDNVSDLTNDEGYDNTETIISAGLITTGTLQVSQGGIAAAGITGNTSGDSATRFWAGATFANRDTAPITIAQNGNIVIRATIDGVAGQVRLNSSEGLAFYEGATKLGGIQVVNGHLTLAIDVIKDIDNAFAYITFVPTEFFGSEVSVTRFWTYNNNIAAQASKEHFNIRGDYDPVAGMSITHLHAMGDLAEQQLILKAGGTMYAAGTDVSSINMLGGVAPSIDLTASSSTQSSNLLIEPWGVTIDSYAVWHAGNIAALRTALGI